MFPKFADVISAINDLKAMGLIKDYAITGAMAQIFWDEAIPTFDLDVLVLLGAVENVLDPLRAIFEWAEERGYETKDEHILINDIPVQFLPAPDPLSEEAVEKAKVLDFKGIPVNVVRPEYLIALWLQPPANTYRRLERVAKLREAVKLDADLLADLKARYNS
jgi:L-alanine-DL-glutamate epimerase-like enolase superfamily enzyme